MVSYLTEEEISKNQDSLRGRLHALVDHIFDKSGPVETYYYDETNKQLTIRVKLAEPLPPEPAKGSQREMIRSLKNVISDLSTLSENKHGVEWDAIAKESGIHPVDLNCLLKRLAQNGEIYQPIPGRYRLSSEG